MARGGEAGGYKLFVSDKNPTGHMGVFQQQNGRFEAEGRVPATSASAGMTAVEAAVAYAKHAAEHGVYPDENQGVAPPWLAAALEEEAKDGSVVKKAGGYKLFLSDKNASGYTGVYKNKGRFYAMRMAGGKQAFIGTFDTAVEAAAAYAEHAAEHDVFVKEKVEDPGSVVEAAEGYNFSPQTATGYMGVAGCPAAGSKRGEWLAARMFASARLTQR